MHMDGGTLMIENKTQKMLNLITMEMDLVLILLINMIFL